jgi:hypothetical protein
VDTTQYCFVASTWAPLAIREQQPREGHPRRVIPAPFPSLGARHPAGFRFLSAIWQQRTKHEDGRSVLRVFEAMVREGDAAAYVAC